MSPSDPTIRLLMVDDERDFLQAVEPGLARRGFDVTLAETGMVALDLLAQGEFDAVILDVKMTGLDGGPRVPYQALRRGGDRPGGAWSRRTGEG